MLTAISTSCCGVPAKSSRTKYINLNQTMPLIMNIYNIFILGVVLLRFGTCMWVHVFIKMSDNEVFRYFMRTGKKVIPTRCCFSRDGRIIAAACQVS